MGILRRPKRAMVRATGGTKLAVRKNTEDMVDMLGLNQILEKWPKHVE